ncbi:MAG TPA: CPBP family intramembrane glutamic endopeptidase [Steroidobacteraceae bacterium]|nr:CPBP family intramembrane glutamic endopeptidase [Steroidobacteraceae bacterium]
MTRRIGWLSALLFAIAYGLAFRHLLDAGTVESGEVLTVLLVVGVLFTGVAAVALRGTRPVAGATPAITGRELAVVFVLLLWVTAYLAGGVALLDRALPPAWVAAPAGHLIITLVKKLLVFVVVPFVTLRVLFGRGLADFGLDRRALRALAGRQGLAAVVLMVVCSAFNLMAGQGAAPIRSGALAGIPLVVTLACSLVWLLLEVGLVEEFFFRAVLQSRIAAATGSEMAGVFLAGLLFGLAHAPGYYLRGAGLGDAIGQHPSVLDAAAYAVLVPAVASFMFAYLWLRTRNLYVGLLVHAAMDTLPSAMTMARALGFT